MMDVVLLVNFNVKVNVLIVNMEFVWIVSLIGFWIKLLINAFH